MVEIRVRDEWDCLIEYLLRDGGYLRGRAGGKGDFISVVAEFSTDEWAKMWTVHGAGIREQRGLRSLERNLKKLDEELRVRHQEWLGTDFEAWKRIFFRSAYELPPEHFKFVGRESELREIEKALSGSGRVCLTAALTGVGGQGKTSIAMHYARANQSRYAAILAVSMDGDTARLNLSEPLRTFLKQHANWEDEVPQGPESRKVIFLLDRMCEFFRGRVLIVIDDVPFQSTARERQSEADQFFARIFVASDQTVQQSFPLHLAERVRFIFTSRRPILTTRINNISIPPMEEADALALFRSRVTIDAAEGEILTLVSEVLGRHPLSIVLVAAYAKAKGISSVAQLTRGLRRRIIDAEAVTEGNLLEKEYPRSLIATLELSYSALSDVEKALLLALSMFRRDKLRMQTIRRACARIPHFEKPSTAAALVRVLSFDRGHVAALNQLCKLELVGDLGRHLRKAATADKVGKAGKAGSEQYQLHEIVFDFAQHCWVTTPEGEFRDSLRKLEVALTRGACELVSANVGTANLDFLDLETLVGLLVPLSNPARGLIPLPERIQVATRFWFDHYTFHNFIYDTGLQELLESQLEDLAETFKLQYSPTLLDQLVVCKLLGHALYADPSGSGGKAAQYFDQALEAARQLQSESRDSEIIETARWYQLFLLDHRTNVRAKVISGIQGLRRLRTFPAFKTDLDEIESILPHSLACLDELPAEQDLEYLLRAAHYWGHRGNQDTQIMLRRISSGDLGIDWTELANNAHEHYLKAVTLRLLATEVFAPDKALQKLISKKLSFLPTWMKSEIPRCNERYERFTSLAQAIGDAAHQLRGLHSVLAFKYLATRDPNLVEQARRALDEADLLWRLADQKLAFGEVPLKYRIWMESSRIVHQLLISSSRGQPIPDEKTILDQLGDAIKTRSSSMKSNYRYAESHQATELQTIYAAIKRLHP